MCCSSVVFTSSSITVKWCVIKIDVLIIERYLVLEAPTKHGVEFRDRRTYVLEEGEWYSNLFQEHKQDCYLVCPNAGCEITLKEREVR